MKSLQASLIKPDPAGGSRPAELSTSLGRKVADVIRLRVSVSWLPVELKAPNGRKRFKVGVKVSQQLCWEFR